MNSQDSEKLFSSMDENIEMSNSDDSDLPMVVTKSSIDRYPLTSTKILTKILEDQKSTKYLFTIWW